MYHFHRPRKLLSHFYVEIGKGIIHFIAHPLQTHVDRTLVQRLLLLFFSVYLTPVCFASCITLVPVVQIFTKESTKCYSTAVVWVKTSLGKRQLTGILSSYVKKYDAVFAALQLEKTQNLRTISLHFALHGNIYVRLDG